VSAQGRIQFGSVHTRVLDGEALFEFLATAT
jgi:hypothetical protein